MALVKNLKLIYRFFKGKFGLGKVFGVFLERNLAGLDHKTLISKSRKICIFPKWLVHGFGQKLNLSSLFLSKQI